MTECNHLLLFFLKDDLGYVHDSNLSYSLFFLDYMEVLSFS